LFDDVYAMLGSAGHGEFPELVNTSPKAPTRYVNRHSRSVDLRVELFSDRQRMALAQEHQ
jgi:hypothetical protein